MGRINRYALDVDVAAEDKWIGVDYDTSTTKNFTPLNVGDFYAKTDFASTGKTSIPLVFRGRHSSATSTVGSLNTVSERTLDLDADLTSIIVSELDLNSLSFVPFFSVINGGTIKIGGVTREFAPNYAFYTVSGVANTTDSSGAVIPGFRTLSLTFISGATNASLASDTNVAITPISGASTATTAGVSSLDGLTGVINLIGGDNVTVTNNGNNITITADDAPTVTAVTSLDGISGVVDLVAGDNVTITPDVDGRTITISTTGGSAPTTPTFNFSVSGGGSTPFTGNVITNQFSTRQTGSSGFTIASTTWSATGTGVSISAGGGINIPDDFQGSITVTAVVAHYAHGETSGATTNLTRTTTYNVFLPYGIARSANNITAFTQGTIQTTQLGSSVRLPFTTAQPYTGLTLPFRTNGYVFHSSGFQIIPDGPFRGTYAGEQYETYVFNNTVGTDITIEPQ